MITATDLDRSEVLSAIGLSAFREMPINRRLKFAAPITGEYADGAIYTGIAGQPYRISTTAVRSCASHYGIPSTYAEKCSAQLLATNLNAWSLRDDAPLRVLVNERASERNEQHVPEIVAFVRDGAIGMLDMDRVLEVTEDAIGDLSQIKYTRAIGNLEHISFSLVGPGTAAVLQGDAFQWGVTVNYSPIDKFGLTAEGYVRRLICLNGATATEAVVKMSRRHTPEDPYTWLSDSIGQAYIGAAAEFVRLREAATIGLREDHRGDVLAGIYEQFGIPQKARELIDDRMFSHGGNTDTIYDLYNHITYIATHDPDVNSDPRMQTRLMRSAGNLAIHHRLCNGCNRPI